METKAAELVISDEELREFLSLLRDWRLAYGAIEFAPLAAFPRARAIEAERRERLLMFLDQPAIDVSFEMILRQRALAKATPSSPDGEE